MKFATRCLAALCALAIAALTPATASAARWHGRGWGWVGPGVYAIGPRWSYAYHYPHHNQHWYSYKFSSVPWRYRGRDDHRWDEE
jgi:hypothetical protein